MRDGYIEDFQLQSSSEDPEYPARKGRPGNDGWCPTEDHAGDLFFHVSTVNLSKTASLKKTNKWFSRQIIA